MRLDLPMPVHCVDGVFGELADVVIDSNTRRVTHLVVEAHDRRDEARLVPIEDAHSRDGSDGISLEHTIAELAKLEQIQTSDFVRSGEWPVGDANWDVGIQDMYPLSDFGGLGPEALGAGMPAGEYDQHVMVSYHRIPKGNVEIRRASPVTSSQDGHLGHVVGFVIDDQEQIAHLVLEHGHLWGKRQVAIPSAAIECIRTDEVVLSLSKDDVGSL